MSHAHRSSRVGALTPDEAPQVRTSADRAQSLKQYIEGLLPSDLAAEVDVVITPHVPTAAVMPATEEALFDSEAAEFDQQEARNLIESTDGSYLVLVTGREATTENICLSDQLTADAAHQFGLAFHETLHILKTSFGAVQKLVAKEIEEPYQDFIHELINIVEDGAIEHEAQTGDDFTERAGNRLTLIRELHSQSIDDFPHGYELTFGEALTKALYDRLIYDTGVTDALLDDSDAHVTFASSSDRNALQTIHDDILDLRDDILALRSDHSEELYDDDREASIARAKRLIAFWHEDLKPLYEDGETPDQSNQGRDGGQAPPGDGGESTPEASTGDTGGNDPTPEAPSDDAGGDDSTTPDSEPSEDSPDDPEEFECPECGDEFESEHGRSIHYGQQHGDTDALEDQLGDTEADSDTPTDDGEIDPDELSLDTDSVDNPLQGVENHPSIGDEPDPDDVDADPTPSGRDEGQPNETDTGDEDTTADSTVSEANAGSEDQTPEDGPAGDDGQTGNDSQAGTEGQAGSGSHPVNESNAGTEQAGSSNDPADSAGSNTGGDTETPTSADAGADSSSETATTDSAASTTDLAAHTDSGDGSDSTDNQQATFGDFTSDESGDPTSESTPDAESSETGPDTEATAGDTRPGETTPSESGTTPDSAESGDTDAHSGESNDATEDDELNFDPSNAGAEQSGGTPDATTDDGAPEGASTREDPAGASTADGNASTPSETGRDNTPARDDDSSSTSENDYESPTGPAHEDADLDPADFESDRQRAQRTADETTVDEQALQDDLQTLEEALGEPNATGPSEEGGGDGAGPGSVDELTILPNPEDGTGVTQWGDIERAADTVADTLAKELRLDQQTATRSGLSAGTQVNTKTAHRLGHNDPRTFMETLPGDEKEYFVVLVLDRSGSMSSYGSSPDKIDVATSAVTRFAQACEDLDIDVAVIDFYNDEARYVKPPSVETEFAQETLLDTATGGRTPLADALGLARSVASADRKESLVISITDDKPNDVDAVAQELKASYAPVCSLTIATDCAQGNPPAKAERLESLYDQTTTVFEPAELDDRLDELASLLGAY